MRAEILSIGDELLIGHVVNTNASFIAQQLDEIGIAVQRIITLGDDGGQMTQQLNESLCEADIVITTGGLGPTHDDITKKVIADFLGKPLVFNQEAFDRCQKRFARRGIAMPKSNTSQAEIIEGAHIIHNTRGTAPGMIVHDIISHPGKFVVILPGVPYEMQEMITSEVVPFFKPKASAVFKHTILMTTGIGESTLADKIGVVNDFLSAGTTLAYLPQSAGVKLRLSTRGDNEKTVLGQHQSALDQIMQKVGPYLYATSDMPLEAYIGQQLMEKNLTLAVAESCTGGLISDRLTNVPGSSTYFLEGVVSYANNSKIERLNVSPETLEAFGAVSEQVALEMAKGCLEKSGADIAISTTGIAGPGGATDQKPVGLVCFGVATNFRLGDQAFAKTMSFSNERIRNKQRFSETALNLIREVILSFSTEL